LSFSIPRELTWEGGNTSSVKAQIEVRSYSASSCTRCTSGSTFVRKYFVLSKMETTRECLWLRSQFWLHVYTYTYNVVHVDGKIPSYQTARSFSLKIAYLREGLQVPPPSPHRLAFRSKMLKGYFSSQEPIKGFLPLMSHLRPA
jgi:hypothetical protein